jgi:hypothetical protein
MAIDLAQMRREIEENYRRDIQALDWLLGRTIINVPTPIRKSIHSSEDECPSCRLMIDIMASSPADKVWTVAELLKEMVDRGHDTENDKRPDARINAAINYMAQDGRVRIVRSAAGRRPKLFVYTGQPNIDFKEDEIHKEATGSVAS